MKFRTIQNPASGGKGALLALLVSREEIKAKKSSLSLKNKLSLHSIDRSLKGYISSQLSKHGYKGEEGKSILISTPHDRKFSSILLFGSHLESGEGALDNLRNAGAAAVRAAIESKQSSVTIAASAGAATDLSSDEDLQALTEGAVLGGYKFSECKTSEKDKGTDVIKEVSILSPSKRAGSAFSKGVKIANAVCLARNLVNRPPNICTPSHLVEECRSVAKKHKFKIEVRNRKDLTKLGANTLLAVAKGSDHEAYMVTISYTPKNAKKKVAIIGKGITFDSGGLSIKPSTGMEGMKVDMAGAAAVLGAMDIIAELKPDVAVSAYIPTCENMIGPSATRVGDIITSLSGKTVEILNTDAEGRLILCDAITLAKRDGCDEIVDIATLTGACVVALGSEYAGFMCSNDEIASRLEKSSKRTGEKIWRLPLAKEYKDHIKSKVADIKNIGKPSQAGSIIGGLFLHEFAEKTTFAHIDIAGTADADGIRGYTAAGGTGFGVRLLADFVVNG